MALELIFQGIAERTHLAVLEEMLAPGGIDRVILGVAFVSDDGVDQIAPLLQPIAGCVTVFAGIRNEITSAQALRSLRALGVSLYVVDTGSPSLLFHPKLYYVRRAADAKLMAGSGNLTLGGLNNNIEGALLADLALDAEGEAAIANELEAHFDGLAAAHPQNIFEVGAAAVIDQLLASGRIIDEGVRPPPRPSTSTNAGKNDPTPRMKMVPKRIRGKAKPMVPGNGAGAGAAGVAAAMAAAAAAITVEPELELVWESNPLRRRSLGIPTNPNSNPTGSTTLGSGTFDHINRVTYFRNGLFGHLVWTLNGTVETANQAFDLVIKGVLVGTFGLTLRYSLTRAAAAPNDSNSPTGLSWNQARPLIAREDLLDRTMRIWRSIKDPTKFRIEID